MAEVFVGEADRRVALVGDADRRDLAGEVCLADLVEAGAFLGVAVVFSGDSARCVAPLVVTILAG